MCLARVPGCGMPRRSTESNWDRSDRARAREERCPSDRAREGGERDARPKTAPTSSPSVSASTDELTHEHPGHPPTRVLPQRSSRSFLRLRRRRWCGALRSARPRSPRLNQCEQLSFQVLCGHLSSTPIWNDDDIESRCKINAVPPEDLTESSL